MKLFDELCKAGNQADALLESGRYPEALGAYADIFERSDAANTVDSFVAAKTTLSILLARVKSGDPQGAHKLWSAPKETRIGQGVHFLELGQTSVHDLMIYFLISAHLYSIVTDQEAALEGMEDCIQRVARYAQEEAPELLPLVIGNWRAHLEEIFEKPLAQVPASAARNHKAFALSIGPLLVPAGLNFPAPSAWQIDWPSTTSTNEEILTKTFNEVQAEKDKPMTEREKIESQMDDVNQLMNQNNFSQALVQVRSIKSEMLSHAPCDPMLLGWVMFFEFKCLFSLKDYKAALAQANEALPCPFALSTNNAGFRASVCSELAVRCDEPVDEIIRFGTAAYEERQRGGEPMAMLNAEDKAEFFAREMIALGTTHGADMPVLKGYLSLMRAKLRAGRDEELRPLVDELLVTLRPLKKSEGRAKLMGEVSILESTRSPLASNQSRLERFLAS
jgi:hypothetical protein